MFTSIQCRIISFYFNPSFDLTSRDQHIAFETLPLSIFFLLCLSQHLYKPIRSWDIEHFKPLGTVHNNNLLWQWRENKICLKSKVLVSWVIFTLPPPTHTPTRAFGTEGKGQLFPQWWNKTHNEQIQGTQQQPHVTKMAIKVATEIKKDIIILFPLLVTRSFVE